MMILKLVDFIQSVKHQLIFLSGHLGAYVVENSVGIEKVRINEVGAALPPKIIVFYEVPLSVSFLLKTMIPIYS
jgi:hypothetical protein